LPPVVQAFKKPVAEIHREQKFHAEEATSPLPLFQTTVNGALTLTAVNPIQFYPTVKIAPLFHILIKGTTCRPS